ncbi:MAG: hypothetical protein JW864_02530, partial [Spirochaetes bacterium]|nr:hypothetical protein [Spirochaetota bacterium]
MNLFPDPGRRGLFHFSILNLSEYSDITGCFFVSVKLTTSSQEVKHEINCWKKEAVYGKIH